MTFINYNDKQVVPLWINGEASSPTAERFFEVINAQENKTVHYAQGANEVDAKAAVDAAAAAFQSWSQTSYSERRALLFKVADLIEQRAEEIARMQVLETSCAPAFANFLPRLTVAVLREIASQISNCLAGTVCPTETNDTYTFVTKEAVGPVLIISPWNSPTILGCRSISSALAAGCTVVLKGSELCPATYRLIVSIFEDAGLPKGCLNLVQAGRSEAVSVTETIIAHPELRKVEFIGSAGVGSVIGQVCMKYLKPIFMELGGKAPAIITRNANLSKAAQLCAFGAFNHHGQICMSTERIIVVQAVADEFSRLLKEAVEKEFSGSAGSAVTKAFCDKAHNAVEEARKNGAKFLVGDNSYTGPQKTGLQPTIVTDLSQDDPLRDTETFGPSATLYVVEDEEEALRLANDTKSGLVGAIWTDDAMQGLDMSKRLQCGSVHINSTTINDTPTSAITGTKGSGWGSNSSTFGINEFLVHKTVTLRKSDAPIAFK